MYVCMCVCVCVCVRLYMFTCVRARVILSLYFQSVSRIFYLTLFYLLNHLLSLKYYSPKTREEISTLSKRLRGLFIPITFSNFFFFYLLIR